MWEKRRTVAAAVQAVFWVLLPFVRVDGVRLFAFDLDGNRIHLLGKVLWFGEFYFFLFLSIAVISFFIAITAVLGRVWCGWVCPQTMIPLIASKAGRLFPGRNERTKRAVILIPVTAVVTALLFLLFVEPGAFLPLLARSRTALLLFGMTWLVIYADLAFWGPRFCATVCPYSILQEVLFDEETLVVEYDRSRHPCLLCGACERVCPTGIDIKNGLQRECIACASCIDACSRVTEKKNIPPFISYRGRVWRKKAGVLTSLWVLATAVFIVSHLSRPDFLFTVARKGETAGGAPVFEYSLRNGTPRKIKFRITSPGSRLLGQTEGGLSPYGAASGTFVAGGGEGRGVTIILEAEGRKIVRHLEES
ncbi:MAG: 4Fe-4S binding protein [Deltaproteobacteria bacterium]|nr:MAG: 4Fe-4S binding protein [Deltaproteobacteria bacterium]